jgi:hypothetical protein
MRGLRRMGLALSGLLMLGLVAQGGRAQTPDPAPRERLNLMVGHWSIESVFQETAYSHAHHNRADVQCDWSPHHGYVVCEYLRTAGKPADHLSIFTYDEAGRSYKHLGISQDVKTGEQPLTLEGNVWTASWDDVGPKGEKVMLRDTYRFPAPDKHLLLEEYSTDGGQHWAELWHLVGNKVS